MINSFNHLWSVPRLIRRTARSGRAGLLAACLTLFAAANAHAVPIVLSPTTATFSGFNNGAMSSAALSAVTGVTSLSIVYKQNAGGAEEGLFAGSYNTVFTNTLNNPSDGLIKFDGSPDPFITAGRIFLYVKDGTPRPWYMFDISYWNGRDSLILTGFYTGPGSISQVSIFTGPAGTIVRAPEGGSTIALLASALVGIAAARRRLGRAAC